MRLTYLGHAGVLLETAGGSILCDPWFSPAYLASWFPFPANDHIDPAICASPDYLYVSHAHRDHFDASFLGRHVGKDAQVLLPDFPTPHLRRALEGLGFHRFVETRRGEPHALGTGVRIAIHVMGTPTDGPLGDSTLVVDDGSARVFNQNDARPTDPAAISAHGPFDAHFLQFSGAIWYPAVYRMPDADKRRLGAAKRRNQLARATRYVAEIGATHVFPSAGPPCFLDEDLVGLNDLGDGSSIFCDAPVFIDHLAAAGFPGAHLLFPGTVVELNRGAYSRQDPAPDVTDVAEAYRDKAAYLARYAERARPAIAAERAAWRPAATGLAERLAAWWEPIIAGAEATAAGINGRILLMAGDAGIVVDFLDRRVREWRGEACRYRFFFPAGVLERCLDLGAEDWVNLLFLSCRFEAERDGPYNEFVYTFFKSLSAERMAHVERHYASHHPIGELIACDGYLIQRRCPHLQADLTRFGEVSGGVLTCHLHGWRFDLASGRCLTSDDRRLHARPHGGDTSQAVGSVPAAAKGDTAEAVGGFPLTGAEPPKRANA